MDNTNPKRGEVRVAFGGEDRLFKFGTNQTDFYLRTFGMTLLQYNETFQIQRIGKNEVSPSDIKRLLYTALVDGCRKDKAKATFTLEDVGDWLDEAPTQDMVCVWSCFVASAYPNVDGSTLAQLTNRILSEKMTQN